MEIRNIATFLKVASTQNFSKAAKQLGYSQSAVTVQIQQLEKELSTQLFERIGKRVYLTEKGQEFVNYANEIMKVTNKALNFSKDSQKPTGKLKIGGVESICTALLPDLILKYHKLYPDVEIVIRSGTTKELLDMARGNELDMVYTLDEKIYTDDFICAFEKQEEICFVAPNKTKYKEFISISDLVYEPFILTELWGAYQYELLRLLAEKNLKITPILEIGNTETIIKLLKKEVGISFLPEFTVHDELSSEALLKISTDLQPVKMYNQLFYHQNKWITPQMEAFINLLSSSSAT